MPRVLLSGRWLALHVFAVASLVVCAGMTWWQFERAEAGNGRSVGYALQWPAFGIFAVAVWIWLCRDAVRPTEERAIPAPPPPVPGRVADEVVLPPPRPTLADSDAGCDKDDDPDLRAWNDMFARLNRPARPEETDVP